MFRLLLLALTFALFCSNASALSERNKNLIVGVRIDDVAKHLPHEIPQLKEYLSSIKSNIGRLLDIHTPVAEIHNIYFHAMPRKKWSSGEVTLPLTAFLKLTDKGLVFARGEVTLRDNRLWGQGHEVIPLSETDFEVEVGLIERKVIIKDYNKNIKMVFPIGVGGFDEGIQNLGATTLVTPRFQEAWIDKREAYATRTRPSYFAGKPFLRLTTNKDLKKGYTAIAFHAQPNLATFFRGFDSHGCIRMQTDDLIAFHRLLSQGPLLHLPIRVLYQSSDPSDHPHPKADAPFKTIQNVGTSADPYFKLDKDDLVQMVSVRNREAPIYALQDHYEDDYHSLYDYDSKERLLPATGLALPSLPGQPNRSPINIGNYCKAKYPYNEARFRWRRNSLLKKYNKCMQEVSADYRNSGKLPHDIYNY